MTRKYKMMKLSALRMYANNPRKNDSAVSQVAESINQVGYITPIVVDENNEVLAGHTRIKALKTMGTKEVEVLIVEGLTDEQKRKYRLLDNKVGEIAEFDEEKLAEELALVDFGEFDFHFDLSDVDWFETRERDDTAREEGNDEYNEFLDKFERKKTTDDCYTPDVVYEAVATWVESQYEVKRADFVRPFYPGGDYESEEYKADAVVVDNPPFSILSEIIRFYCSQGIKFFLFAPALTLFGSGRECDVCYLATNVTVTYENGANISTSFVTNMDNAKIWTAPELHKVVENAADEYRRTLTKELPKYSYPNEVVTAAMVGYFSKYGVDFRIYPNECARISQLDAQKEMDKAIFGGGFLCSEKVTLQKQAAEKAAAEKAAAEKAAAEKAKAHIFELSEREQLIVRLLGE